MSTAEGRPLRVFVSNTPGLRQYPVERSFVIAAGQAITRAGGIVLNMAYFTAREDKAAGYRRQQVRRADVHAGIIGFRYGSPLRDEPELSHMEADSAAAEPGLPRLLFLLDEDADLPLPQNHLTDQSGSPAPR